MKKKYKWGILAPGRMSAKFTKGLKLLDNVELYAVGSRDAKRAEEFALEYGFKKHYGSYKELAEDPDVDIIYIASPHTFHYEHTMLCLKNRKAVLCEKVFALNSREVEEMVSEAERQKVFLMEALWPPFQPFYKKADEILKSGLIGNAVHINGYFSFIPPYDPNNRKFNLALGGCSLHDIGIYPLIDAITFFGIPDGVKATAVFGKSRSEESVSAILSYKDGRMATIYSSYRTNVGIGCDIFCEKGNMTLSRSRDMNQRVILCPHDGERKEFVYRPDAMGYHLEAEEVMKCLDEGKIESSIVPHSFSRDLISILDRIRYAAGIFFPGRD